ncbi:MAG: protein kinase [Candidatus Riflebacteria bacterium]|nr:protein kinase [Candidatus Riflebacteria bacterium]
MGIATLEPGVVLGRYELGELLGHGAMADVFRATDRSLGRPVALKVLHPIHCEKADFKNRFLREARVLGSLSHENLVKVFDCDEQDGWVYIAMELVSGETLAQRLAREPQPPLAFVMSVGRSVLAGLNHVHARDVIHRDIKPQNILLETAGDIKIVDFGLVKAEDNLALTQVGTRIGTPQYMSPEQVEGQQVTYQSDLFATGVVLYEMLTGRPPADDLRDYKALACIRSGEVPPPSKLRPGLPEELDKLVLKALSYRPWERFESAKRFSDTLDRVRLPGEEPPPATVPRRSREGGRTVVETVDAPPAGQPAAATPQSQTVVEQFQPTTASEHRDHKRKKHKRHHKRKRRRWPIALGLLLGVCGTVLVAAFIYIGSRTTTPAPVVVVTPRTSSSPHLVSLPPLPPAGSPRGQPHPLESTSRPLPSFPEPRTPPELLTAARSCLTQAKDFLGKGMLEDALRWADLACNHLDRLVTVAGAGSLSTLVGAEGHREVIQAVDAIDEVVIRSRRRHGVLAEVVFLLDGAIPMASSDANKRLSLLNRLVPTEKASPAFWDVFCRCSYRMGWSLTATFARYLWLESIVPARGERGPAPLTEADLQLLGHMEEGLAYAQPRPSGPLSTISRVPESWVRVWEQLRAGLAGQAPAPAPAPSAAPSPSADLSSADILKEMERMEEEIVDKKPPRPQSPADTHLRALRPRDHKQAAPGLARLEAAVKGALARPAAAAVKDGSLATAVAAVTAEIRHLRACAKVDDLTLEFLEPGRPGLYETLRAFTRHVSTAGPIDALLRTRLQDYSECLRDLAELPCDDAAYRIVAGHALLVAGNTLDAEVAFVKALGASLYHPEGTAPAGFLMGQALLGLAATMSVHVDITPSRSVGSSSLPDLAFTNLQLVRLHILATGLGQVPPAVRRAWSFGDGESAAIDRWQKRARDNLMRRGLVSF